MHSFLPKLIELSLQAGQIILDVYAQDFDARQKADGSAVTDADEAAEAIILKGLQELAPEIPVLAEEAASRGKIPELGARFFLVDPLDGTREFVNKTGEFTVNIALIEDGVPVLGVVTAPALGKAWFGAKGDGAWVQAVTADSAALLGEPRKICVRAKPATGLIAVASRSHRSAETETMLKKLGAVDFKPAGSSLKFCLIAEGDADVYPRLGRTMEWDTAAGQAVLEAAGGRVHELDEQIEGKKLRYGKISRGYDNPYFIAWGA